MSNGTLQDAPGAKLDVEEHVQPPQGDGLDGEEVDGEHALRLCAQERAQRESGALARRPKPAWRRRLRTVVAETVRHQAAKLACDPPGTPARVLTREA